MKANRDHLQEELQRLQTQLQSKGGPTGGPRAAAGGTAYADDYQTQHVGYVQPSHGYDVPDDTETGGEQGTFMKKKEF